MKQSQLGSFVFFQLAILWSANCFGQNTHLEGTVFDKSTKQPVALAHVRVGDIVTYTNEEGVFNIRIPQSSKESLEIFHMGYDIYFEEIHSDEPYLIGLDPVEPNHSIEGLTGADVMNEVFNKFHLNYDIHDQYVLSYYREVLTDSLDIKYIGEGILEVLLESDVGKSPSLVRPIKTRYKSLSDIDHKGIDAKSGHATEMVESSIFHEKSFLSEKFRWNYEYTLIGTEVHRNENIYVIDFMPANKKGTIAGRIFVDANTYAIIRLEYTMLGDIEFDTEVWIEEFQHHDLVYYLLRASFEGTWEEDGERFLFRSLIVNTEIESDMSVSDRTSFIPGNTFTFPDENVGEFSDDYWGEHNYIKLTQKERAQLE